MNLKSDIRIKILNDRPIEKYVFKKKKTTKQQNKTNKQKNKTKQKIEKQKQKSKWQNQWLKREITPTTKKQTKIKTKQHNNKKGNDDLKG